jgi:nicotinamide-nucleotide amidase
MKAEIVMIGTELLLGQIVDTNAAYIGQTLMEHGISLYQKTTVGDNPERIRHALAAALDRSDVVLTSGGLGPTEDDVTREAIAELFGRPLEFRQDLFDTLAAFFARFNRPMTENNARQAWAPRGATAIPNPNGTAPGLIVEDPRGTVIAMPGVPGELKEMLRHSVIPYLRATYGIKGVIHYRVLKVSGIGESRIDALIGDLIRNEQNPTVGVLASPDVVRIRIAARAESLDEANALIDIVDSKVRQRLPNMILGVDDQTLEAVVDQLLAERGWHVAIADGVTGGLLSHRLSAKGGARLSGALIRDSALWGMSLIDMTRATMLYFTVDCALGLAPHPETGRTLGCFLSPSGAIEWDLGVPATNPQNHLRVSVIALEHLRRFLMGHPVTAL